MYTTEVVTTVRFAVRHEDKLSKEEMLKVIADTIGFEYLLGQDDYPSVIAYAVISDEIVEANTPEEEYEDAE